MGIFFNGSNEGVRTSSTSLGPGTGDWAMSYWTTGQADGVVTAKYGVGSGYTILCNVNKAINIWYAGNSGSNSQAGPNNDLDGTLKHVFWAWYSGVMYAYVDGVSRSLSTVGTPANLVDVTSPIEMGDSPSTGFGFRFLAGVVADCRIYNNPGWIADHANISKIVYEQRGDDNITDGLTYRSALTDGPDGTNISGAIDVSGNSLDVATVTNTPQWTAEALKGF